MLDEGLLWVRSLNFAKSAFCPIPPFMHSAALVAKGSILPFSAPSTNVHSRFLASHEFLGTFRRASREWVRPPGRVAASGASWFERGVKGEERRMRGTLKRSAQGTKGGWRALFLYHRTMSSGTSAMQEVGDYSQTTTPCAPPGPRQYPAYLVRRNGSMCSGQTRLP